MSDKLAVTLAYPYTDPDGKDHKADADVSLDRHEAKRLLREGLARPKTTPAESGEKQKG